MRVYFGPYRPFYSTRSFEDWLKSRGLSDRVVDAISHLLQPFCDFLNWVTPKRVERVIAHEYDIWSMKTILAKIVVPMLNLMLADQRGAPFIDNDDVPEEMWDNRSADQKELDNHDTDDHHFKRWDYVLGEMLFAFESHADESWEKQFWSGESDFYFESISNGMSELKTGPKHTHKRDDAGYAAYQKRIDNGLRLFAKYYGNLWT